MTDVGELVVRIKADATQLQQELAKVGQSTKNSADQMTGALGGVKTALEAFGIALSVAGLIEFGKSAIATASSIQNMADRIGFSTNTVAAMRPILAASGSGIEELAHSVYMMNSALEQAPNNPKILTAFNDLGLSVTKLKAMNPEDAFNAIIDALGRLDSITRQTNDGRAIFSRSFATLIPLVKEANGHLETHIELLKQSAPSEEQIKRVHDFGVAIEDAGIRAQNSFIKALAALIDYFNELDKHLKDPDSLLSTTAAKYGMDRSGYALPGSAYGSETMDQWMAKSQKLGYVTSATRVSTGVDYGTAYGPSIVDKSGRGNNNDITQPTKEATNQLNAYIGKLQEEATAAEQSQRELFVRRAEIEASTKAQDDFNNGLRSSKTLTDQETQSIDAAAGALYDHTEQLKLNKQIGDQLGQTLAKIATNFKDLKSAVTDFLNAVANEIIKTQIATPFGNSLSKLMGNAMPSSNDNGSSVFSSVGHLLGFASGGDPPVGVPSIVGENGPELFVPNSAGTIVPNGGYGSTVIVQQTINMSPGLPETVNSAIRNAAPAIAAMAHAGVMQALQKGGTESKIAGLRNS